MTTHSTRPTARWAPVWHAVAWWLAAIGGLVALIGVYLLVAPADGTLTLVSRTWAVNELRDAWASPLLMAGGVTVAIAMTAAAALDRSRYLPALVMIELAVAGAGVIAALVGVLVLL